MVYNLKKKRKKILIDVKNRVDFNWIPHEFMNVFVYTFFVKFTWHKIHLIQDIFKWNYCEGSNSVYNSISYIFIICIIAIDMNTYCTVSICLFTKSLYEMFYNLAKLYVLMIGCIFWDIFKWINVIYISCVTWLI